jgi:hypothetical protein
LKKLDLSLPQFGFVVATRAALGAGIGLLAADKIRRCNRRRVGATLLAVGALTTIPAAFMVFAGGSPARSKKVAQA